MLNSMDICQVEKGDEANPVTLFTPEDGVKKAHKSLKFVLYSESKTL
jgi:hypothetical protein